MKKIIAALLVLVTLVSLAACSAEKSGEESKDEPAMEAAADALTLMNKVWEQVPEADRFPVSGGDYSEENMKDDAPGNFGLADTAAVENYFGLPEASVTMVDQAASLTHMMNLNSFSAAAFHVTKSEDIAKVVSDIQTNLAQRQWVCGFPDQLVIATLGSYVVSFYGLSENIAAFKTALLAAYPDAAVAVEENLG